jgi:pimeloyl-ACP methyl ester carboxylesterase
MSGMWMRYGEPGAPVAVVLPGSGSTAEFVARTFAGPLATAGHALVTADPPPAAADPAEEWGRALDDLAGRTPVALVGGVSLGAHAAVRWAAHRPGLCAGLLLVMPAWTGPPDDVAAVSGTTAAEVESAGIEAVLTRLRGLPTDAGWVLDELELAWPRRTREQLVAELRGVAASRGPSGAELALVGAPCGVVALRDDPLHPEAVARQWAAVLPSASLTTVDHRSVATGRQALAHAALGALRSAGVPTASR